MVSKYSRSHKNGLMVRYGKKGIVVKFMKTPSGYNSCIGNELRGGHPSKPRDAFKQAVSGCK